MKFGRSRHAAWVLTVLFFVLMLTDCLRGQTSSGTLRGRVTDPTGAVIPQARVTATGPSDARAIAITNAQGTYELKGLLPGSYTVETVAKGFATSTERNIVISVDQVQQFDIGLEIQVQPEKIEVQEDSATVVVGSS